jgi:hypothetical protein
VWKTYNVRAEKLDTTKEEKITIEATTEKHTYQ